MNEIVVSNKFSLLNSTFSSIELDLETKKPFYVGNFTTKTQRYSLKPKCKLKVSENDWIKIYFKNNKSKKNQLFIKGWIVIKIW